MTFHHHIPLPLHRKTLQGDSNPHPLVTSYLPSRAPSAAAEIGRRHEWHLSSPEENAEAWHVALGVVARWHFDTSCVVCISENIYILFNLLCIYIACVLFLGFDFKVEYLEHITL